MMFKKDKACAGCRHYVRISSTWMCNYWEDENRKRPCPPGAQCTVKKGGTLKRVSYPDGGLLIRE